MASTRDRRVRLGTLVRQARKARGLSQRELAIAASLSINTVGSIEAGGSYRRASLDDVALVLRWPAGATDAFLRGDEGAIPAPPARTPAVEAERRRILNATPEQLVEMALFIEDVMDEETGRTFLAKAMRMREAARAPRSEGEPAAG